MEVTLDHLVPQVLGGTHHSSNLITACARCNKARQAKPWWKYAPAGAHERIRRTRRRVLNYNAARVSLSAEKGAVK